MTNLSHHSPKHEDSVKLQNSKKNHQTGISKSNPKLLTQTSLHALAHLDKDGYIKDWNEVCTTLLGWTKEEVLGNLFLDLVNLKPQQKIYNQNLTLLKSDNSKTRYCSCELSVLHKDGNQLPLEITILTLGSKGFTIFFTINNTQQQNMAYLFYNLRSEVSKILSGHDFSSSSLLPIFETICKQFNWIGGAFFRRDLEFNNLTYESSWTDPDRKELANQLERMKFTLGRGVAGVCWNENQTMIINLNESHKYLTKEESILKKEIQTIIGIPIIVDKHFIGVFEFFLNSKAKFEKESVQALEDLVNQIGQLIRLREGKKELLASLDRMQAVLNSAGEGIITTSTDGIIESYNPMIKDIFGYSDDQILNKHISIFITPSSIAEFQEYFSNSLSNNSSLALISLQTVGIHLDGSNFPLEIRFSSAQIGEQQLIIGILRSLAQQQAHNEALAYQAQHDSLTGLPNRNYLRDLLQDALTAPNKTASMALLVMDLDDFKEINDALGHETGDMILQQMSSRISNIFRESDCVARLGGDEFAVFLDGPQSQIEAITAAKKMLRALEKPFLVKEQSINVGASIGIALFPEHGLDSETLLRRSDIAMYIAKKNESGFAIYAPVQEENSVIRLNLMGELRHAIGNNQLILHYQPKIDFKSRRTIGVEALVRWNHPKQGLLYPENFIPWAEHSDQIKPLTRWVINDALRQLRTWLDLGLSLKISVNISARNLQDHKLPKLLEQMLSMWSIPAALLTLEITESDVMIPGSEVNLRRFAEMGITLSIDDFGTGYTSLSHIKELPFSEIKIDKSFIQNLDQNPDDAAIVRPTIELAHNLNRIVVAEGVKNDKSWEMLRKYDCDIAQGYILSPPISALETSNWLTKSKWGLSKQPQPSLQPSITPKHKRRLKDRV